MIVMKSPAILAAAKMHKGIEPTAADLAALHSLFAECSRFMDTFGPSFAKHEGSGSQWAAPKADAPMVLA